MIAFKFLKIIIKDYPFLVLISSIILIITGLLETISLLFIAPIMEILIDPSDDNLNSEISNKVESILKYCGFSNNIFVLFTFFIGLNIFKSSFQTLSSYLILKLKYALGRELTINSFKDFFNSGWAFFRNNEQGKLINTFSREINIVGDAFAGIGRFSSGLLQLIIFLTVPFYISWQVMVISMFLALIIAFPIMFLGKVSHKLGLKNTTTANELNITIQESLSSAKIILGFSNQDKSATRLDQNFRDHIKATLKSQILSIAILNSYNSFGLLAITSTIISSRWFEISLPETSILIISFIKIIPLIGEITKQKNLLDSSFPSYQQVDNLRRQAKYNRIENGSKLFTKFKNQIIFKDFSFSYDRDIPTLKDINITIKKGSMIALVGNSGSGKTTLVDSLIGFNKPLSGHIEIDGIHLKDFDINSFRSKIGYVPQESILFNLSIRDNLLWANESASELEIESACELANAKNFVENFPEKYNTLVGDRGVRLSGGEIQRIAIARAMVRKPELLILDEATSALDSKSEGIIKEAIDKIADKTTLIVVAHRLSTILNSDCIYVLEDGIVVESGNYNFLYNKKGKFYTMVKTQKFMKN